MLTFRATLFLLTCIFLRYFFLKLSVLAFELCDELSEEELPSFSIYKLPEIDKLG